MNSKVGCKTALFAILILWLQATVSDISDKDFAKWKWLLHIESDSLLFCVYVSYAFAIEKTDEKKEDKTFLKVNLVSRCAVALSRVGISKQWWIVMCKFIVNQL